MKRGRDLYIYILKCIGRAAWVTLLAFLFSFLILEPLSFSAMSIFSSPEKTDFSVSDLYAQVADRRPVRTLDSDIVIVDVGHSDRRQIAEILDQVNFWNPKVVAVDIMFRSQMPGDSLLLSALEATPRIVLPIGLTEENTGDFKISEVPFFYPALKAEYAATNLPSEYEGGTIREFATGFRLNDGGTINSFPVAAAGAYDPKSLEALKKRGNHLETIDYASREFVTLTPEDLVSDGDLLSGRLVLIGANTDSDDMHSTPVNSYMSGVRIQAASIATVLSGHYYDNAFDFPAWLPACILCFLILLTRELTKSQLRGFITRLMQLLTVYLAVRIGYSLYVDSSKIFNFSYTMLMATFGIFANDIWAGLEYIGLSLYRLIRK